MDYNVIIVIIVTQGQFVAVFKHRLKHVNVKFYSQQWVWLKIEQNKQLFTTLKKTEGTNYENTDLQLFPALTDRPVDDDDREGTYNNNDN